MLWQDNHIYTSGAMGTNAAVIKGALRANRPDKLTVILPQSLKKQPYESQELLQQVRADNAGGKGGGGRGGREGKGGGGQANRKARASCSYLITLPWSAVPPMECANDQAITDALHRHPHTRM